MLLDILLTNPFLCISTSSMFSIPLYQDSLDIMFYYRTKYIPVSPISIHELVPRISLVLTQVSIRDINDLCH